MKKSMILVIAVIAMFMSSCNKEEIKRDDNIEVKTDLVDYTLSVNQSSTKAYIDGKTIKWNAGDRLAVYDGTAIREFTCAELQDGDTQATFKGQVAVGAVEFEVVYPYEAASLAGGALTLTLPSQQNLPENGTIDPKALVSYDKISDNAVVLHPAVGFVKIEVSRSDIKELVVEGTQVAGNFTVNANATIASKDAATGKVSLKPSGDVFAAGTYFIPLIPGTTDEGFKVKMYRSDNFSSTLTAQSAMTIAQNKPSNFGALDALETLAWRLQIGTKDELLAWNDNYANWSSQDEVVLTADIDCEGAEWTGHGFQGKFIGYGHVISGLKMEKGFFSSLYGSGRLERLVVGSKKNAEDKSVWDEVSTITMSEDATAVQYIGLVGIVKDQASMENVGNYASVTLKDGISIENVRMGGVTGQWSSSEACTNCDNFGEVSFPAGITANNNSYVAGVFGMIATDPSQITNCDNNGLVKAYHSKVTRLAGVAGEIGIGSTLTTCHNRGEIKDYATISAADVRIAGICAATSADGAVIDGCKNVASVYCSDQTEAITNQVIMGGIVGYNSKAVEIKNCENSAEIIVGTTSTTTNTVAIAGATNIGGIIGFDNGPSSVTNCTNKAGGNATNCFKSSAAVRLGCIAGYVKGAATYTNCNNVGGRAVANKIGVNTSTEGISVGGIVGVVGGAASFVGCSSSMSGTAGATAELSDQSTFSNLGGIAGLVNGEASFDNCDNSIEVKKATGAGKTVYVGGIIGCNKAKAIAKLENCDNSAAADCKVASTTLYAGGIIGGIEGVTPTIKNCVNSGAVYNSGTPGGGNALRIGGIVGGVNSAITIDGCINTANVYNTGTPKSAANHWLGGIIGLQNTSAATIQNCIVFGSKVYYSGTNTLAKLAILVANAGSAPTKVLNNKVNGTVGSTVLNGENYSSFLGTSNLGTNTGNVYISEMPTSSIANLTSRDDQTNW